MSASSLFNMHAQLSELLDASIVAGELACWLPPGLSLSTS